MKVKDFLLSCTPGGKDRIKELERYGPELAPKPRKAEYRKHHRSKSHHTTQFYEGHPTVSASSSTGSRSRTNSRSRHSSGTGSGGSSSSASSLGVGKSTFYDMEDMGFHRRERSPRTRRRPNPSDSSESPIPSSASSDEQSVLENLSNYDLSSLARAIDSELKIGSRVVWLREAPETNEAGVVRWLGHIDGEEIAGVEFDNKLNVGSGWYNNEYLFDCKPNHGGLIAVIGLILEDELRQPIGFLNDFEEAHSDRPLPSRAPQVTMLTLPFIHPPLQEVDAAVVEGSPKGIQGNNNSCYLDATLFAMFPFSSVFDSILSTPCASDDPTERRLADDVQRILREGIVNPLRSNYFTPAGNVLKLREKMQHLDNKLMSEEMDPAEFLELLFRSVLHLDGFLTLSSNQSEFFHQVVCEGRPDTVPTVQELLEESLRGQKLKLTCVPSPVLILQMPRSGNKFKMFKGVLPNLTIDITDLIEDIPRMCIICGSLATEECEDCLGHFNVKDNGREENGSRTPLGSMAFATAFCHGCLERVHQKADRRHHRQRNKISYSFNPDLYFPSSTTGNYSSFPSQRSNGVSSTTISSPDYHPASYFSPDPNSYGLPPSTNYSPFIQTHHISSSTSNPNNVFFLTSNKSIPRVRMDLFAVICIETSHFVSFVKCGPQRYAPWVFFDSMADRQSHSDGVGGYNIPQVTLLPHMGYWLDAIERDLTKLPGYVEKFLPLKRLISDAYICLYSSTESAMYN